MSRSQTPRLDRSFPVILAQQYIWPLLWFSCIPEEQCYVFSGSVGTWIHWQMYDTWHLIGIHLAVVDSYLNLSGKRYLISKAIPFHTVGYLKPCHLWPITRMPSSYIWIISAGAELVTMSSGTWREACHSSATYLSQVFLGSRSFFWRTC